MDNKKVSIGEISIISDEQGQEFVNLEMFFQEGFFSPNESALLNNVCSILQNVLEMALLRNDKEKEEKGDINE